MEHPLLSPSCPWYGAITVVQVEDDLGVVGAHGSQLEAVEVSIAHRCDLVASEDQLLCDCVESQNVAAGVEGVEDEKIVTIYHDSKEDLMQYLVPKV